ncbi:MAG: class I SAM-dependent methyltransferase [Tannerella sp.]|jgi:hypothetical protein|nr:class I SAM-dependent methyltransferase [Tannerella sp.]
MQTNESLKTFIVEHANDDVNTLILNCLKYKDIDVKQAAKQIAARKIIKDKLPAWHENMDLIFLSTLAAEQCSSEWTALYKQRFVNEEDTVYDLTGGLGVDAYYFSQKVGKIVYIEQNKDYCDAALINFQALNAVNIEVLNKDSVHFCNLHATNPSAPNPVLYIDPSRRSNKNKRVYALEDCEPDLTKIWQELQQFSSKIIVKLSPMLDICHAVKQLSGISEIHVVSVRNDCKELIIVADKQSNDSIKIVCVNYLYDKTKQSFVFTPDEEKTTTAPFTAEVKKHLYEPNASVLKAGAYKSVAARFNMEKLHPSSHLYTSDRLTERFPGRIFEVSEVHPFNNQTCNELSKSIAKANITVRNFPLSTEALRKKLQLKDGGDIYLFATTLSNNKKVLIQCCKKSF